MNKLLPLLVGFLIFGSINAQWCVPTGGSCDNMITSVTITDVTNAIAFTRNSGCGPYDFYTADTVQMSVGEVYIYNLLSDNNTLSIGGTAMPSFVVFVDWDRSGTFEGTESMIYPNLTGGLGAQAIINVPANASLGLTRMRIYYSNSHDLLNAGAYDACPTSYLGDIEDYVVNITSALPSTETPCASNTSPSNGAFFPCADTVTLSWTDEGTLPSEFILSLGTNAPNYNNILDSVNIGDSTSYVVRNLMNETQYGWKVTATNAVTGDSKLCPLNFFTTGVGRPETSISPQDTNVCLGNNVVFNSQVSGGYPFDDGTYTYKWSSTAINADANDSTASYDVGNNPVELYEVYLEVVDTLGCMAFDTATFTVNQLPSVIFNEDTVTICNRASVELSNTIQGGQAPYNANWSASNGTFTEKSPVSPYRIDYTVDNENIHEIIVQVTDSFGCASENDTMYVEAIPSFEPELDLTSSDDLVCEDVPLQFNASVNNTNGETTDLNWFVNGNELAYLKDSLALDTIFTGGEFEVVVNLNVGGCAVPNALSDTVVVNIKGFDKVEVVDVTASDLDICEGDSILFNIDLQNDNNIPFNYKLLIDGVEVATDTLNYQSKALSDTGVFTVITIPDTACSAPDTFNLGFNVKAISGLNLALVSDPDFESGVNICEGDSASFIVSANDIEAHSIEWFLNNESISTGVQTLSLPSLSDSDLVSVNVEVNDESLCIAENSAKDSVMVNALDIIELAEIAIDWGIAPKQSICEGDSVNFSVDTSAYDNNISIEWFVNGNSTNNNTTEYTTDKLFDQDEISVEIFSNYQCPSPRTVTDTVVFTVNEKPATPIIDNNQDGTISTRAEADEYYWYYFDVFITNDNDDTLEVPATGNYTLIVRLGECFSEPSDTMYAENFVGLNETILEGEMELYPNPASTKLSIDLAEGMEIKNVEILSIEGKLVKRVAKANKIDVQDLNDGQYILKVNTNKGILRKRFSVLK